MGNKHRTFEELIATGTEHPQPTGQGYEDLDKPCLSVNCIHSNGRPMKQYKGKMEYFTRALWKKTFGYNSIGDKLVCHLCDTPFCVEISHLTLGTPRENAADKVRAGTSRMGIPMTGLKAKGMPNTGKNAKGVSHPTVRGEKNGLAKLTEIDIPFIRDHKKNGMTCATIHRTYYQELSVETIRAVIYRKTWRHVP